jgi:hypothetical protein
LEHGHSTGNKEDIDATAAAKAKLERDAASKELEEETKRTIEST